MSIINIIAKEIRFFVNTVDPRHGTKIRYISRTTGNVWLTIGLDAESNWSRYGFSSRGNWVDYFDWAKNQLQSIEREKDFRAPNGIEELLQKYPLEQYRQQLETQ